MSPRGARGWMTLAALLLATQPQPTGAEDRVFDIEGRVLDIEGRVLDITKRTQRIEGDRELVTVEEAPDSVEVQLAADVFFAFDQAVLTPQAEGLLAELAPALADRAAGPVAIEGHTDAVGDASYNQALSERRAEAVRAWLAGPGGLPQLTFEVRGLGETQPLASETGPDGSDDPEVRARNRRVTIRYQTSEG